MSPPDRDDELEQRLEGARAAVDLPAVLRLARKRCGLTLTVTADRVRDEGHHLSVSTLSSWERGHHRPERTSSLDLLPVLERVYGLDDGALRELTRSSRPRNREAADLEEMAPDSMDALLARTGPFAATRVLVCHHLLRVEGRGHRVTVRRRYVVEALEDGVDHHLQVVEALEGSQRVTWTTGGETAVTEVDGLRGHTVSFGRDLVAGETQLFEFEVVSEGLTDPPAFLAIHASSLQRLIVVQVTFTDELPARVWRSRWPVPHAAPVDDEEVSLDSWGSVLLVAGRPMPQDMVGLRWSW